MCIYSRLDANSELRKRVDGRRKNLSAVSVGCALPFSAG